MICVLKSFIAIAVGLVILVGFLITLAFVFFLIFELWDWLTEKVPEKFPGIFDKIGMVLAIVLLITLLAFGSYSIGYQILFDPCDNCYQIKSDCSSKKNDGKFDE